MVSYSGKLLRRAWVPHRPGVYRLNAHKKPIETAVLQAIPGFDVGTSFGYYVSGVQSRSLVRIENINCM